MNKNLPRKFTHTLYEHNLISFSKKKKDLNIFFRFYLAIFSIVSRQIPSPNKAFLIGWIGLSTRWLTSISHQRHLHQSIRPVGLLWKFLAIKFNFSISSWLISAIVLLMQILTLWNWKILSLQFLHFLK